MTPDEIIVTLVGLFGIVFTYWFFLGKKEKPVEARGSVDILVEGGYTPSAIFVPVGQKTKINFLRKDPSSCLEEIIIPDFRIRKTLPLNKPVAIEVIPPKAGEYGFACGMNMYHGKIIAK